MIALETSTFRLIPVNELQLDLDNPRIAQWIEIYGDKPTAEHISLALGAGSTDEGHGGPSIIALKESIRTNKGIIHPIVVNRQNSGNLIVIEGNTRTQIYGEFQKDGVPGDWSSIPALVYSDLGQEDIDAIRLQAHLVGVRQWDPYSKAKYLHHLSTRDYLTLCQIVDYCGGNKREVNNYIQAYKDMQEHYSRVLESDDQFDPTRFSAFVELQASRVSKAIQDAGFSKTDFAEWVHERKLSPISTVRQLPRILQDAESRETFLKKNAQEALRILDAPDPSISLKDCSLAELAREVSARIAEFKYDDLQRLRDAPECMEAEMFRVARDALREFCNDISPEEI